MFSFLSTACEDVSQSGKYGNSRTGTGGVDPYIYNAGASAGAEKLNGFVNISRQHTKQQGNADAIKGLLIAQAAQGKAENQARHIPKSAQPS